MCVFQKLQFNVLTDDSPVEDVDFGAYVVQRIFGGVRLDNDGSVIGIVSTVAKLAELVNRDFVPVVTNYTVVAFLVLVGSSCVVLNRNEVEVGTLVVPDEGGITLESGQASGQVVVSTFEFHECYLTLVFGFLVESLCSVGKYNVNLFVSFFAYECDVFNINLSVIGYSCIAFGLAIGKVVVVQTLGAVL